MATSETDNENSKYRYKNKAIVTDSSGKVVDIIDEEPGETYDNTPVYKKADGSYTRDPLEVSNYSLTDDGAIKLTAPKELYETPEFHEIFNTDTLKAYSEAYRTDSSYRVPYMRRKEDGTTEEVQMTIPEFVDELNVALDNFIDNYRSAEQLKDGWAKQYGDKAKSLSLTQVSTVTGSNASANRVYLPDFIFETQNVFSGLKDSRAGDKTVDTSNFMKYYNLGKTSADELAGVMATIEGHLKGSDWSASEEAAQEATAALALKNFILSRDPDAEWYESLGAGATTLAVNAAEGITRVFMNLGTMAEGIVTFGQSHVIQNATENMDNAVSNWNQDRMLIQDSTATLATIGQIGGMLGGTILEAWLLKKVGGKIEGTFNSSFAKSVSLGQEALAETGLAEGMSAYVALAPDTMFQIAGSYNQVSLGAKFVIATMPIFDKVTLAASTAKAFLTIKKPLPYTVSFLLDTVGDAIRYDAVTLRHVIEGDSDQNVKNYWLGQLEDNAKWWIGTGFAKTTFKFAGRTAFGQALDAKATQKIQGAIATVGDAKKHIKDSVYGGDFIRRLEEIHDNMKNGPKKDRIAKQLDIAKGEEVLRKERKALANLDLEWDGFKLSDESMSEFREVLNNIKTWENAIDARAAGTTQKVQELVGQITDPSTGRIVYVNPSLGVANAKAGNIFGRMMSYTEKYNLPKASGSYLSQDMVDYLVGSAEKIRKTPIAEGKGPNASAARANIDIIESNLKAIEDRLPDDVMDFLKNENTLNSYFEFYRELRNYQDAKNIVDRGLLASYRGEDGESTDKYMPIVKMRDESDIIIGRKSNAVARSLDEDFEEFTYSVKEGQHYVDPEVVRQRALWQTAEDEISQNLRKAYDNMSSATVVERVSGETSQRMRNVEVNNKELERTISAYTQSYTQNWDLDTARPAEKRKYLKNLKWDEAERSEVAAMLSLSDTTQILQRNNVLVGGNTKLTNLVNEDNYKSWFNAQSDTVKRYLNSEYSKYDDIVFGSSNVPVPEDAFDNLSFVKNWSQSDWDEFYELTNTLGDMEAFELSAKNGGGDYKRILEIRQEAMDMAKRVPYKGIRNVKAIKEHILQRLRDYGLSTSLIDNIEVGPSNMRLSEDVAEIADTIPKITTKSILNGDIDVDTRIKLAKQVVDESNGEKLIAWRTQGEGVDNFHGSSGGTQAFLSDQERGQWAGGRWIFVSNKPFNIWGYGTEKLVFPINKADILNEFDFSDYVESADDVLALKAKNPTEAQKIAVKSLNQIYDGDMSKIPRYAELFGLDDETLRKIAEGDPRTILDISDKKIIKYPKSGNTVGGNAEYVIFPDRNPELLQDGVNDMARVANNNMPEDSSYGYKLADLDTFDKRGFPVNEYGEVDFGKSGPAETLEESDAKTAWHNRMKEYADSKASLKENPEEWTRAAVEFESKNPAPKSEELGLLESLVNSPSSVPFETQNALTRGEVRRALYEKGFDGIKNAKLLEDIENADNNFAQVMTSPMVLYRGETSGVGRKIKVGDKYDSSAYTYLGTHSGYTDEYRQGATGGKKKALNGGYVYRFHLSNGQPVFHSSDVPNEFILPRDVDATVVSVKKDIKGVLSPKNNPKYIVDVEVDPNTGYAPKLGKTSLPSDAQIPADYSLKDIESGKLTDRARYRIARKVEQTYGKDTGGAFVAWRAQNDGIDKFYDTNNPRFKNQQIDGVDLDGAYRIEVGDPTRKWMRQDGDNIMIFPIKSEDWMSGSDARDYKSVAETILDNPAGKRVDLFSDGVESISDEALEKMKSLDDATLKKIADGDPKALLDISGKKVITVVDPSPDGVGNYKRGIYVFPDRNPEVLKDGFDAMTKAPKGPLPGSPTYLKNQLNELFNSKTNQDFLKQMGYENGYHFYGDKGGNRASWTYGHYSPLKDQIGLNWRRLEANLESLESLEFHEISHMVWQRASDETRKAVGQDLINLLGIKGLEVDDAVACSRHMNELVAHAMETRFQSKKGWDVLKNDAVTKEHIDALAKYAGAKPTEGFKDRVMTLLRSFVTYVKTKVLGINSAKTFDEFYYGLLHGDFSEDLKTDLYNFGGLRRPYYDELRSKNKLTDLDVPNKSNFKVDVESIDDGPTDIDVNITRTIPIDDLNEGPSEIKIEGLSRGTDNDILGLLESLPGKEPEVNYPAGTYDLFKRAMQEGGDDFEAGLQRAYLVGDEKFGSQGLMTQLVNDLMDGKEVFGDGFIKLEARQALRNILQLDTDNFVDSMYKSIKNATDDYVKNVMENPKVISSMNAITNSGENGAALAAKYTALKYLTKDGKKDITGAIEKEIRKSLKGKGLKADDVDLCVKRAQMMTNEYIKAEFNDVRNALKTTNGVLVDDKDMFAEVKKLRDSIYGKGGLDQEARKNLQSNIIVYRDEMGREVYAEVDPNFASLYKMRYQLSRGEASALAKFNAVTSKLFRYGTTTLNLSSFSKQLFKDSGSALILGGSWYTIKHNADNLIDVFGEDIVEQIKRFEPEYEMKQLEKYAEMNNMSLKQAAVSREMARGAALSPATTETTLYKDLLRKERGADGLVSGMEHKLRGVLDKFASVDEWTNGKREEYLRKRVYANNFSRALEEGYTLQQARSYALFAMNNATTNFTRQIYHMQAIAESTPYFRAAINGTKSFWRMYSIDPVGISGRIMGGLILPTIFLTGASLGDPDNKEVYKNIPEYQKDENLIFVVDKQIVTVPIPQEMANIVSPIRQFVEHLYYTDQNSFWELMMNDALGFSPVDITGFSTIDMDKMSQDPTIKDRITRGFARIFSQVAPVPVRSTYMMVTGTDPYTGKNLYDPSYTYWDDDTSSIQTMNDNQNAFAKWVAKLWGKDSNATVLEKVTSGIFGSTTTNILGELVTLIEEGPEAAVGQVATDTMKQVSNPYYAEAYNQTDAMWKRAVRALTAEKEAIVNSDEFKTVYSELSQTTDESKRKKLMATGQNMISEYQNKVINTVQRLASVYKGTYDRKKFAATIQLLNFNTSPIYQSGTQYSSNIASEAFYEGRESAISTMQALGVTGTNDLSIFGYLVTDDEGNSVMKYSSPVAIMDMKHAWMGASNIDTANIEAKLKTDKIKLSQKWDGYYTAKDQGKAALKAYKSDWNAKVVKSLAPYISERGVDSVLKNTDTRDLLERYLFVDNLYQVKAYLKKIFENE